MEENNIEFMEWLDNNRDYLELEFISQYPPEDQPLDDDYPDFINNHIDEFEEWAEHIYFTTEVE